MYQKIGNEIRSERGVLVATLSGDRLIMAPGKKSQEEKVRAFLQENSGDDSITEAESGSCNNCTDHADETAEETESPDTPGAFQAKVFVGDVPIEHVEAEKQQDKPQTEAEWQVGTIPDEELPPFTPEMGVNTPGFGDYIKKHNLNKEQTAALIKRICRTKGW